MKESLIPRVTASEKAKCYIYNWAKSYTDPFLHQFELNQSPLMLSFQKYQPSSEDVLFGELEGLPVLVTGSY